MLTEGPEDGNRQWIYHDDKSAANLTRQAQVHSSIVPRLQTQSAKIRGSDHQLVLSCPRAESSTLKVNGIDKLGLPEKRGGQGTGRAADEDMGWQQVHR